MIEPNFIETLAAEANLSIKVDPREFPRLADQMTDALHYAASIAVTQLPNVPAQRRDWCELIAKRARDLADSLGVREDNPDGGWAPWLMHANLEPGIEGLKDSADLVHLLNVAVPSRHQRDYWHSALEMQGRISPALLALALIADAAAAGWQTNVAVGGRPPNLPRHGLVVKLCVIFEELFDRRASVYFKFVGGEGGREYSPDGAAIKWFRAFFRNILPILEAAAERDAGSMALVQIARDALKSPRDDALGYWLNDARRRSEMPDK